MGQFTSGKQNTDKTRAKSIVQLYFGPDDCSLL
jgi:hypothetical protein